MSNEVIELENGFTRNQSRVSKFITEARSNLNLNELKAFYQLTTLINMEDKDFNNYEISIKEFVDTLELHNKDRAYIKKICKNLLEQNFILDYTHENNDWDLVKISIFKQFSYKHKEQKLLISFSDDIKPYLLELKERFTKIENVEYIKKLEKKYAIRFYALLKDYRKMTYRDFDIEALHKMLQLPKSYLDYGVLKQKVLEPAMREINEKSDLYISLIEEIKKERKKVLKIRIHFGNKSEKIADEKIKYLLEIFYKNRANFGFSVFHGMYYINPSPNVEKRFSDIRKITNIDVDRATNYHELYLNNQDNCSLMSKNTRDFLRTLCEGIHEAIVLYYENEKKHILPLELWQEEQDEEKAKKQRIEEYKDIIRMWKGIKREE